MIRTSDSLTLVSVGWLFRTPTLVDAELERRARLAMSVVRALTVAVLLVIALSLLDPANVVFNTVVFYMPVLAGLFGAAALIHRGHVNVVGWGVSLLVWATITAVLLLFGGLNGHNAMAFVIAMTIAGTVVSGRAALAVGALSIGSAGLALVVQASGHLPPTLSPVSAFNSFIAVTVTMLLGGWLLALSLRSLQRALDAERAAARERDLAHATALRSQRLESVGRLAAGVAHDLNNVLTVVQLTTDALVAESSRNERLTPLIDDLRQAADQAALLSRRMVGMSRAGGTPPEWLDVGAVTQQFVPLMRRLLPAGVVLRVEVKSPLQRTASRSAIEHVLLNLVLNARDAMPAGGTIDLVVDGNELQVKDTGVGMSPEVRARLFTPFFTTREKGNGLGLVNVAELVESMGARVEVESELGKGSTFRVVFPEAAVKLQATG